MKDYYENLIKLGKSIYRIYQDKIHEYEDQIYSSETYLESDLFHRKFGDIKFDEIFKISPSPIVLFHNRINFIVSKISQPYKWNLFYYSFYLEGYNSVFDITTIDHKIKSEYKIKIESNIMDYKFNPEDFTQHRLESSVSDYEKLILNYFVTGEK